MADFSTVARPYARAVFELAQDSGDLDGWSEALAAAAAITGDRVARDYLRRPGLGVGQRIDFVGSLAGSLPGGQVLASPAGRNLLALLAENDRLDSLGEISKQFDARKAEREHKVKVRLVAAANVDTATANRIAGALGKKLGRTVELELEIDSSLVGGAIVRAEDMVIDDSIRTRLTRLTSSLVE